MSVLVNRFSFEKVILRLRIIEELRCIEQTCVDAKIAMMDENGDIADQCNQLKICVTRLAKGRLLLEKARKKSDLSSRYLERMWDFLRCEKKTAIDDLWKRYEFFNKHDNLTVRVK